MYLLLVHNAAPAAVSSTIIDNLASTSSLSTCMYSNGAISNYFECELLCRQLIKFFIALIRPIFKFVS